MGIIYFAVCHDCKQYINLDKLWHFAAAPEDTNKLPGLNLEPYINGFFVYRTLRLFAFLKAHAGHRIEIQNDAADEQWYEYQEVMKWPPPK